MSNCRHWIFCLITSLMLSVADAYAGSYLLVPGQQFYRETGAPVTQVLPFTAVDTASSYTINLYNGGLEDYQIVGELVSSSTITLNGTEIFSPTEFNQGTTTVSKTINVNASNHLEITLQGKPGGVIIIEIVGEDNVLPIITATVDPAANAAGWHNGPVSVSYSCADGASGVASCPNSVTVETEGAGQIITGTARDHAGNEATTAVTLNIDSTAPLITTSADPQPNLNNWNNTPVTITYSCVDSLSGVASCSPPVTLTIQGQNQTRTGQGVDIAGNSAETSHTVNIDLTPPELVFTSPASGAELLDLRPAITLALSDNIALQNASLALTVNGNAFAGSCALNSGVAVCTPDSDLPRGDVRLQASIDDIAGNNTLAVLDIVIQPDRDGDGVPDVFDAFPDDPTEWADLDGDGIGDNSDPDRDGDGISNDYEIQLGTDPNDAASTPPDLDGDGIPDSLDADRDGDGISNDYETQAGTDPDDATSTPPDLDGDGIPDVLDDDRDGDGVSNQQDSYPDDATRTQLAAVENLTSAAQGPQIQVSWQAHPETFVQGYRLYRADYDQSNWTLLNTTGLITATTYADAGIINGNTYRYRVSAVDDRNNEGIPSTIVNQFIAFNLNTVSNIQVQWSNYQAVVDWSYTLAANENYRLYKIDGTTRTPVLDAIDVNYTDPAAHWSQSQSYELVTVLSFSNPITAGVEQREGPAAAVQLAALPAISMQLADAVKTGDDAYRIEIQPGLQLTITGTYSDALAPVQLTLSNSQGDTTDTSADGEFRFVVRDVPSEQMTISLVESGAPADRGVSLSLNVTPDQTPLTVVFDSGSVTRTGESFVEINGQVINADAGVKSITAGNARYPGQSFGLALLEDNIFSGELPLKAGDNPITVSAADHQGQSDQASLAIVREASAIPSVEITSHSNNQVVTSSTIKLQGRLYTTLQASQLQCFIAGQAASITPVVDQVYQFELDDVRLTRGFNRIVTLAQTPFGSVETAVVIYYQEATVDAAAPMALVMTAPTEGEVVNDSVLILRGQLFNASEGATLTVGGVETQLFGEVSSGLLFSYAVDLASVPEGPFSIDIAAVSPGKLSVSKTVTISIDKQAPVLVVNNTLAQPPAVNEIRENPYRISGSVSDVSLSTLTVNGQGLVLQPAGVDTFSFDANVNLTAGQQSTLTLSATDTAGNATIVDYLVLSNPQAGIEVIQPLDNTEYRTTGASHAVEFITRITGTGTGDTLLVSAGSSQQSLAITQEIVNGTIDINPAETIESLHFEVRDAANATLASTSVPVVLINEDTLPVTLVKTNPARNETGREPHHPIQFTFNKPVALADLVVTVRETVHGKSYSSNRIPGARFENRYKGEVVEVHKDQADVGGGLSLLPGGRIVEFYPDQDISYGASVFVRVEHQGLELARFIYEIRPNPTFITGVVFNQSRQTLADIEVSLPELGHSATTNQDGAFIFGPGIPADKTIASGLYSIVINPGGKNPAYGVVEQRVNIEQGSMNDVVSFTLPALDPLMPYNYLSSGQPANVLASGDLIIDTTGATLGFADDADAGNVHTQLLPITSGAYKAQYLELTPHWMFNLQPGPITVTGEFAVEVKMPALFGSRDYLPADGTPVLIMGQDADSLEITPIGVGVLTGQTVKSETPLRTGRLDFIGVNLVAEESYPVLHDYMNGDISLAQLLVLITSDGQ